MKKILLIEDDIIDQLTIERALVKNYPNISLDKTMNIKEAIEFINTKKYDLIVSDVNVEDGKVDDILAICKTIPIIIITGEEPDAPSFLNYQKQTLACFTKDHDFNFLKKLIQYSSNVLSSNKFDSNNVDIQASNKNDLINLLNLERVFNQNQSAIKDILETFLIENPANLKLLKQNIDQKEANLINAIAHKMKTGYRVLGLNKLYDLTVEIENAEPKNKKRIKKLIDELDIKSIKIYPQVEAYLKNLQKQYD